MQFKMPMAREGKKEPEVFIPSVVRAARATVFISDLAKPLNIPADRPTNITGLRSLKELQGSRVLRNALKMGMVVEAKEQIL